MEPNNKILQVKAKDASRPLSLKYVKILRLFLLSVGAWSDEEFGKKTPLFAVIQRKTLALQTLCVFVGSIFHVYYNFANIDFFVFGHILLTQFMGILIMARSTITNLKTYGTCLKSFINFHLISYKDKGAHYDKISRLTDEVSYYFTLFQLTMMTVGAFLFILTPLYADYKMGAFADPRPENMSLDYAVFLAFPGFRQDEHFIISFVWNAYISFMCGTVICGIDLLLSLMVFQMISHIKTLMLDLETMKKPKAVFDVTTQIRPQFRFGGIKSVVEIYDEEENNAVHLKLVEMINHHSLIISFANKISKLFGPMLALNYLFHLVSGCILLLLCTRGLNMPRSPRLLELVDRRTTGTTFNTSACPWPHDGLFPLLMMLILGSSDDLMRFGPLTCIIFGQLVELSVVFEVVGYMSERLIDSVYSMPWECMNIRNRRTMHFMLRNVQTPIKLDAMGVVTVGVQTMLQIIKTTFTYYTMLKQVSISE